MDAPRRETIPFDVFIKRSWPLLAVGAVFILAACAALLWFAISGKGRKVSHPATTATTSTEQVVYSTSTSALVPRALDGVLVEPSESHLLPFAVMIDNHPDARPQAGLAEANVVIEAPVEGGMSRYMAIFDATTTADQIGPVRSARPYFVDIANGLGAVYAHVGGSPDALSELKTSKVAKNVDEYFNSSTFWRSAKRAAPHNVYTKMDLLRDIAKAKYWQGDVIHSWRFADELPAENASGTKRGTGDGPSVSYPSVGKISWSYDRRSNMYARKLNGTSYVELDGTKVQAKNIIVLQTEAQVLDSEGRLRVRTTGRGTATIYHDGNKLNGAWTRTSGGWFQFETVDGADMTFARGSMWIEITADASATTSTNP
jgi:hypothetical protein